MRIRAEQEAAFEEAARRQFFEEMVRHSKDFTPILSEVIGEQQLRLAISAAMTRADLYGFTLRGPIRLYIEMMFLCGSGFDTDPQYEAVGKVLRSSDDQMFRANQIHEGYLDYLEKVSGPNATNVHKALSDLLDFTRTPPTVLPEGLQAAMLREMKDIFPLKVAYIGDDPLKTLIQEAISEAESYGFFTARSQTLIVVLKFAFGHACTNDPLYPWISRTLKDEKIVDSAARAARLEKKAITWLEHVVARNERGPNA